MTSEQSSFGVRPDNVFIGRRMVFSGMLRRVTLVRTDVSEELTRVTRRNIPEDTILHSHRRGHLKAHWEKLDKLTGLCDVL
jgi:hypothetical protein